MTFSHEPWLVLSVLVFTALWLGLVAYFQRYLRTRHPAEFVALGEPSFRIGKGQFLRIAAYIYRRRHTALGSPRLSFICDAMAVCLTAVVGLYVYACFTLPGR
ncbi:hypothetical protein QLQ15_05010 [Lysobacter sp. LF1]|uniref:Uncharacterized protein n=1 Tax=Lysobacter stagni TaxID=3045172 RepID=A0ABT6XDQ3_9GAMM|nr:hypothetical protein [Lysobacter sp. LF1]MDI9238270.1 hypothetical protein [Lysobacter sp. LF1]